MNSSSSRKGINSRNGVLFLKKNIKFFNNMNRFNLLINKNIISRPKQCSEEIFNVLSNINFKYIEGIHIEEKGKFSEGRAIANRKLREEGQFNIKGKTISGGSIYSFRGLDKHNNRITNKSFLKKSGICSFRVKISGY